MEKTISELNNYSCFQLRNKAPRKQIITSRSFSKPITQLSELQEAITTYSTIAANKLVEQKSLTGKIFVFLQTNIFSKKDLQYSNCIAFPFHIPTADSNYIIRIAKKCINHIYKGGYKYHKAGVVLIDLIPNKNRQYDFFEKDPEKNIINIDYVYNKPNNPVWQTKFEKLSKRYTTRWEELMEI